MSEVTATPAVEVVATIATPVVPKSVAQRASRKRFSFGPVWNKSVIEGKASDLAKLVEQGVKLKIGARSDLKKLKLVTLRAKVASKLEAPATPEAV